LFFRHPTIKNSLKMPDRTNVLARFDENVLKEPKQLLDEIKFLVLEGMLDPRSGLFELGRDADLVASRKMRCREENSEDKLWEPIFDRNTRTEFRDRFNSDDDEGGRPPSPGTTQGEGTRNQSPAPGI